MFKVINLVFIVIFLFTLKVNAQSVPNLTAKLSGVKSVAQVNLRNQLSTVLIYRRKFDDVKKYSNEAIRMAKSLGYQLGLAKAYSNLAIYYVDGDFNLPNAYNNQVKSFKVYTQLYNAGKITKNFYNNFIQNVAMPTYKKVVSNRKSKKRRYKDVMQKYQVFYADLSEYISELAEDTQTELENTEYEVKKKTYSENLLKDLKKRLEDSLFSSLEERTALQNEVLARQRKIENDSLKSVALKNQAKMHKQEAERQKAESARRKAESDRHRVFNIALILGLALVAVFAVYIVISLRKQKKSYVQLEKQKYQIEQQNQEIQEQRNDLMEKTQILEQQKEEIETQRDNIQVEQQKSESLLLNILPRKVAFELKEKGSATPQTYEMVSVLFTDFKGFTKLAEQLKPQEVIDELNLTFTAFDEIIEKYNMERIKTIGDAYMAAGGLPTPNVSNPIDAIRAGLEMQEFMKKRKAEKLAQNKTPWELRLGIHTGEIIAGVVGKKKFAYDIWGDTVNLASRMESSGEVEKVNISESTYEKVKHIFKCTHRGEIKAKNKGLVNMYFVEERISS